MKIFSLTTDGIAVIQEALQRPTSDLAMYRERIRPILESVRSDGDAALLRYTEHFDGVRLQSPTIPRESIAKASDNLPMELREAIDQSIRNVQSFHRERQEEQPMETVEGVRCWRETRPIENVGLYVPGGTAPLVSTAIMLGVPARLAGVPNIALCTPPQKKGSVPDAILYVCNKLGIENVCAMGGAQAVGAFAYGTQTIRKRDLIAGPGNIYVTAAKAEVSIDPNGCSIDMTAGPSELMVIADDTAEPRFIAADLLSQAEHDPSSQVVLLCTDEKIIDAVQNELEIQLIDLPRRAIAEASLNSSVIVLTPDLIEAMRIANRYAPEHLSLQLFDAQSYVSLVNNAGSVFVGSYTPESVGDYSSGTNHVLPTLGKSRVQGGVSVRTFQKRMTVQNLTETGLGTLRTTTTILARTEGLEAHARAVDIRFERR